MQSWALLVFFFFSSDRADCDGPYRIVVAAEADDNNALFLCGKRLAAGESVFGFGL
jgi:hypothetical protein